MCQSLVGGLWSKLLTEYFNWSLQNPEEQVTFDTVPNVKKQHEVNIGRSSMPTFWSTIP